VKVSTADSDGIPVLKLEGDFDSFETDAVRRGFAEILSASTPSVVVDLSEMTFANSTTIASFISAQRDAKAVNGTIVLANPRDFIRRTLVTLGLHNVFKIADSVEEALAELRPQDG
jgi:anti-sigma B factor antagonist